MVSGGVVGASVGLIERERELEEECVARRCVGATITPSAVGLRERLPRRMGTIEGASICTAKGEAAAAIASSAMTASRIVLDREGDLSLEPRTRDAARAEREQERDEESLEEEESAEDMESFACGGW